MIGVIWRRIERFFAHRHFGVAILFFAIVALVVAGIVYELERGQDGASIQSFGDAGWWSIVTITTVGYGETYPVTGAGRALAAGLMIVGISPFGVIAANLASIFVQQDDEEARERQGRIEEKLDALIVRMEAMEQSQAAPQPEYQCERDPRRPARVPSRKLPSSAPSPRTPTTTPSGPRNAAVPSCSSPPRRVGREPVPTGPLNGDPSGWDSSLR